MRSLKLYVYNRYIVDNPKEYLRRHVDCCAAVWTPNAVEVRKDGLSWSRSVVFDTLMCSFLWENFIVWFNYDRGLSDLAPAHVGLFEGTPVNSNFSSRSGLHSSIITGRQ